MAGFINASISAYSSPGVWTNQIASVSVNETAEQCSNYLVFQAEPSWWLSARAVLYGSCLLYCFVGLATITSLFMQAMGTIAQKTRKIVRHNDESGTEEVVHVRVWNPVIADITLLALGTSAPQISLSVIDAIQKIGQKTHAGLGPETIVGSAAFNLFPILAVCVLVPKAGSVKRIQNVGVWIVELSWSIWAYVWLAIILQVSSPNVVEPWEAMCTVLQFPILMTHAYIQDKGWENFFRPLWSKVHFSWSPLKDFSLSVHNGTVHDESAAYPSSPGIHLDQHKPEWELVDLQYRPKQEISNGFTCDDHLTKPIEWQQVAVTVDRNEDDNDVGSNQELLKPQCTYDIYEPTAMWTHVYSTWKKQFLDIIVFQRQREDNGKNLSLAAVELIGHLITLPWRFLFAFLPPPSLLQGWPAFLCALAHITVIACFLIKLTNLFGCVTGISKYTLALTVLAAGTSLPDLIASKIAADIQPTADSAIANINASNCINVYVGIGIPWLVQSFYNWIHFKEEFRVPSAGLGFALILFYVTFAICIVLVIARRFLFGGELGGPRKWAWVSSFCFLSLWLIFVIFSCLRNNHHL